MKNVFLASVALGMLAACSLTTLPQGECGDGYVTHTSPAGNERCIKPGMAVGDGVIETGILIGAGALAVHTGAVTLP